MSDPARGREGEATVGEAAPPTATALNVDARPPAPASVRWGGYAIMMGFLLGAGYLGSTLHPTFITKPWWWVLSGVYGQAFFATATTLGAFMVRDAADLLLDRGQRLLARVLVLLGIVAVAFLMVWAYRRQQYLVAAAAVMVVLLGPLLRRILPGLPRAKARIRRR